jgi:hypothetical protein
LTSEGTLSEGLVYTTSTKLNDGQSDALVVMCSDRRFQEAYREFLSQGLGLARWDAIVVPGGGYMFSFAEVLPKQLKVGTRMVRFIMQASHPARIILINHERCVRYYEAFRSQLNKVGFSLPDKQKRDLQSVAHDLREAFPDAIIDAFYASVGPDDRVGFERL